MGLFRKSARNVVGVNTHFPYTFLCLTSSFRMLREQGLIDDELMSELFDSLLSFWDHSFSRKEITEYEYSNYFIMTGILPKAAFIYSYEISDEEMSAWESITMGVMNEFQKYRSLDLRGDTNNFAPNMPTDVVQIIESKGFDCPVGSPNFVMAYAVANTFGYIISRTDTEPRMERLGKRLMAIEILPVFLAFWYFRRKN